MVGYVRKLHEIKEYPPNVLAEEGVRIHKVALVWVD